jgi:hypothetical protein
MKPSVFMNCTAHELTDKQIVAAKKLADDLVFYEFSKLAPNLYDRLINCPSEMDRLANLLNDFKKMILALKKECNLLYIHFPIGSPFFMALFFASLPRKKNLNFVFSHTNRISTEEKNLDNSISKTSVFEFQKFLIFSKE